MLKITIAVLFLLGCGLVPAFAQNNVLTQHNDLARSGLNPNETLLTPANVNATQFGKLFTQNVDGMVAAQPLYASSVLMSDGLVHNVIYVVTQHNTVFAFDADNNVGANANPIWSVSLDDGGTSDPISDWGCTGTHYTEIGIMGTPVIDPGVTTLYVVAKTLNAGVRNFSLHALDVTSGNELLGGPVVITGNLPSGNGSGTFNPIYQMQRPSLLLENGEVYVGFGGNGCDEYSYSGWLFAYNSTTLNQDAAFVVTPDGQRGSFWGGGTGPSADEFGNIYGVTANGTFDGPTGENDYSDSVLKFGWNGSTFGILDYFTPYNQLQLANQDLDLGSSGALILPDQPGTYPHELIAGGKQGTLYLINRDTPMGEFDAVTDNVIEEIPKVVPSELVGSPAYWNGSVYIAGTGDAIKQFSMVSGMLPTEPTSESSVVFNPNSASPFSITANGTSNGILWAIQHQAAGILYAFDPTNLANEFYNTNQAAQLRDKLGSVVRFATPTISNGKVYVGGSSALTVYGLLPALSVGGGNNQSGFEGQVLPVGLTVLATDAYAGAPIPGVSVTCKDGTAGGVFTPSATQTTNASGSATFTFQLPSKPGTVTITCTATGYLSTVFTETATTGAPSRMTITSGNKQTGPDATPLAQPFVLKVLDSKSFGVPGVSVAFTDNGAGGSFSPNPAITSSNGTATTQYTTGPKTGSVTVTASTTGVASLNLKATVVLGPPATVAVTAGNNQTAAVGTALPRALSVLVTDLGGNPISGAAVTFTDGGAGGTFSNPNPAATGSAGTATLTYTLPTTAGPVTITATVPGVTNGATFSETATAGPASSIAVTGGNGQSAPAGTTLPQPLTVLVADQYGNPVSGVAVTFSDGGVGGVFSNANPQPTTSTGTATQIYTLPSTPGTVTITATAAGVATGATFTETGD